MNYFELFGLMPTPRVDPSGLQSRYFELQRKYHPDHFTDATEEDQQEALQMSSVVNQAYKTLKSPELTLAYFLGTCGMMQEDEKYSLPNDFLMEMMELNELAEENPAQLASEAGNTIQKLETEANIILSKVGKETLYEQDLVALKEYYFKKKYLKRILERNED
jgi:molecular chaperone HscB